jgi:hypothetical protein
LPSPALTQARALIQIQGTAPHSPSPYRETSHHGLIGVRESARTDR